MNPFYGLRLHILILCIIVHLVHSVALLMIRAEIYRKDVKRQTGWKADSGNINTSLIHTFMMVLVLISLFKLVVGINIL